MKRVPRYGCKLRRRTKSLALQNEAHLSQFNTLRPKMALNPNLSVNISLQRSWVGILDSSASHQIQWMLRVVIYMYLMLEIELSRDQRTSQAQSTHEHELCQSGLAGVVRQCPRYTRYICAGPSCSDTSCAAYLAERLPTKYNK
jgi:hypothetical protein